MREHGATSAAITKADRDPEFRDRVVAYVGTLATGARFTAPEVRRKVGPPRCTAMAMGGAMLKVKSLGLAKATGEFDYYSDDTMHVQPVMIWERL
jgi:hypothetical protein